MKYSTETINKFLLFISKEKSLTSICEEMEMNSYEILGLVNHIREKGINIAIKKGIDDIYMLNMGDIEFNEKNTYSFQTDDSNEFKFIAIADTRLGSKYGQLSILNDIYQKGYEMGYNNVIHCGNISAGLYPLDSEYAETNFADDTQEQIDYIVENYPQIEGIKTYFITGQIDDKHLKKRKINIGKRISELRDDLIYLGRTSCDITIDKSLMQIISSPLKKPYAVSYRAQQQIDSYRSEDKPNIILYSGNFQMDKFTYRSVHCVSIPSVCATTKEMTDKRYSNTIGAWYITARTNQKGQLESLRAISSPYYKTIKDDYLKVKKKTLKKENKEN